MLRSRQDYESWQAWIHPFVETVCLRPDYWLPSAPHQWQMVHSKIVISIFIIHQLTINIKFSNRWYPAYLAFLEMWITKSTEIAYYYNNISPTVVPQQFCKIKYCWFVQCWNSQNALQCLSSYCYKQFLCWLFYNYLYTFLIIYWLHRIVCNHLLVSFQTFFYKNILATLQSQ